MATSQKENGPGVAALSAGAVGPTARPRYGIGRIATLPVLVPADATAAVATMALAVVLRFGGAVPPEHAAGYLVFFPVLVLWRLFMAHTFGLYDFRHRLDAVEHFFGGCGAALFGIAPGYLLLVLVQAYYWPEMRLSRLVVLIDLALWTAWFVGSRGLILGALRRAGYRVRVLLAGPAGVCEALAAEIRAHAPPLLEVAGALLEDPGGGALEARIGRDGIDQVIAADLNLSQEGLRDFLAQCDRRQVDLFLYPGLDLGIALGTRVVSLAGLPLLSLRPAYLSTPYKAGKRCLDLAAAVVLLVATVPVSLAAALAVRLDSPGPVLFVQERVGLRGRVFRLYKFRTMVEDAEAGSGPTLAAGSDPRVTRVGRLLRRCRVDELPQLWNVLRGHMSLVGPRPERPPFVARFLEENPLYERRFLIRPGLTGLAQIHGRYDSDYSHKLRYDLIYLNAVSLGMDLRILLATVRTVLTGRGAV